MTTLDNLAEEILADLLADFLARSLDSEALRNGYAGASLPDVTQKYCSGSKATQVEFDLALKELETGKLVKTGPMVPFQNDPISGVSIFAFFSKRDYVYLTEKGYRASQKVKPSVKAASRMSVHISGGNFHQSPIGVGDQVTQSVNVNVEDQTEVIDYLLQLLTRSGATVNDTVRQEVGQLVYVTEKGDLASAKPIFQRLFGVATDGIKQVAWGVVSTIVAKQMGF